MMRPFHRSMRLSALFLLLKAFDEYAAADRERLSRLQKTCDKETKALLLRFILFTFSFGNVLEA